MNELELLTAKLKALHKKKVLDDSFMKEWEIFMQYLERKVTSKEPDNYE